MAVSVSRKKPRLSKKIQCNELGFFYSFLEKILFRLPAAVLLLVFIYIWSSSTTVFSGNVVHFCVTSRKLNNLYCLSAGTQPNFQIPVSLVNDTSDVKEVADSGNRIRFEQVVDATEATASDSKSSILAVMSSKNETVEYAYMDVEEQLKTQRSWISISSHSTCEGRGIYVYELPSKFNKDLLVQCDGMIPWLNFCKFLSNEGLGEPIYKLGRGWYHTHQYSLEPIFHARALNHPCRVYNQDEAKLFYVPYYGGLDILRWHFKNVSNDVKDAMALDLVRWLEAQTPWYRNLGKDHVFVLGKISWDFRRNDKSSWGTRLLELDEMQNPVKLLIERQPWQVNDIGIPHPTYFHPHEDDDIITWQLKVIKSERENLVSFAGADRPDSPESIRSVLIEQCTSTSNGECKFLNCSSGQCDKPESIIELFMSSEFCLQPPGDSPTRKSVFDSLVSGCIPVLFDPMTVYYQYPWHFQEDRDKYSVFIDKEDVRKKSVNVVERLMKIPERERENMRRFIAYELLPGLVYGDQNAKFDKFQDAFSVTINNLLERVSRLNEL
ncbi:Acetylglucosaminyltransferase EXT1/exostosin 1 [Handroanthus impetiginosus]|uniref:Acetylglucosaminyltransferase EXT1/exostosin 1 n=1 Tax=Handroanthus impetiginosus TaxID=429701 RepID=A0A2G9HBW4_9LAMI|nr:Acetylglucosaminyltransferase EXT1/exostosin 1 [Handroanthus impetiginosus]